MGGKSFVEIVTKFSIKDVAENDVERVIPENMKLSSHFHELKFSKTCKD